MLVYREHERENQGAREWEVEAGEVAWARQERQVFPGSGLSEAWSGPALGSECPLGLATNPALALAAVWISFCCCPPRPVYEVPLPGL